MAQILPQCPASVVGPLNIVTAWLRTEIWAGFAILILRNLVSLGLSSTFFVIFSSICKAVLRTWQQLQNPRAAKFDQEKAPRSILANKKPLSHSWQALQEQPDSGMIISQVAGTACFQVPLRRHRKVTASRKHSNKKIIHVIFIYYIYKNHEISSLDLVPSTLLKTHLVQQGEQALQAEQPWLQRFFRNVSRILSPISKVNIDTLW